MKKLTAHNFRFSDGTNKITVRAFTLWEAIEKVFQMFGKHTDIPLTEFRNVILLVVINFI